MIEKILELSKIPQFNAENGEIYFALVVAIIVISKLISWLML